MPLTETHFCGIPVMSLVDVLFEALHPDVRIPAYQSEGAAAFDVAPFLLDANTPIKGYTENNEVTSYYPFYDHQQELLMFNLRPRERALLPTGLRCYIRKGYELQGRGRSSAFKHTLRLCNGVATIDCDYRGELFIPVENVGKHPARIVSGERMIQFKFDRARQAAIGTVPDGLTLEHFVGTTERGAGGFGSTGK